MLGLADLQDSCHTVHSWHHQINDQQMYMLLIQQVDRFIAVICLQHTVPFLSQIDLDRICDLFFIIAYKNRVILSHSIDSPGSFCKMNTSKAGTPSCSISAPDAESALE